MGPYADRQCNQCPLCVKFGVGGAIGKNEKREAPARLGLRFFISVEFRTLREKPVRKQINDKW